MRTPLTRLLVGGVFGACAGNGETSPKTPPPVGIAPKETGLPAGSPTATTGATGITGDTAGTPPPAERRIEGDMYLPDDAVGWITGHTELAFLGASVAAPGDVTGDGLPDIVAGTYESVAFVVPDPLSGRIDNETEAFRINGPCCDFAAYGIAGIDADGDGQTDLAIYSGLGDLYILRGPILADVEDAELEAMAIHTSTGFTPNVGEVMDVAGDLNADGIADLLAGGYRWAPRDEGGFLIGVAFLLPGGGLGASGLFEDIALAEYHALDTQERPGFGSEVAGRADQNGDGIDDLLIGSYNDSTGSGFLSGVGAFHVFDGSLRGVLDPNAADATVYSSAVDGIDTPYPGVTLVSMADAGCLDFAGDVDGDGYDDIVVGRHRAVDEESVGTVYLIPGPVSGVSDVVDVASAEIIWARAAERAGDLDGDGFDDFLTAGNDVHVFYGPGPAGFLEASDAADATIRATYPSESLEDAGDLDGDGYPDLLLGSQSYSTNWNLDGAAFVVLGGVL